MSINVIHRFYNLFGYTVEIRIQSSTFQSDLKKLGRLAEMGPIETFKLEHERACKRYGYADPELIRLATFAEFMVPENTTCELCGSSSMLVFNESKCAWACQAGCPN